MKKNDLIQFKSLSLKELGDKLSQARKELTGLVVEKNMKKLKDVKAVSKKRRDIAQITTILKQRTLLGELENKMKQSQESKKA